MNRLKFLPLTLAVFSILVFSFSIFGHEQYLKHSRTIYIELAPVDPRSLLQGDYMVLNYLLNFVDQENSAHHLKQHEFMTYVQLDHKQRIRHLAFDQSAFPNGTYQPLMIKNPRQNLRDLYPAANSFMFAEGLEPCYREAKFAELKVNDIGKAMLVGLFDKHLKSLQCESQQRWHKG